MSIARRTSLRRPTRRRLLETAAVLALVVAACGSDDPVATPVTGAVTASTTVPAGDAASTTVPAGQTTTTTLATGSEPADAPPTPIDASTAESPGSDGSSHVEEDLAGDAGAQPFDGPSTEEAMPVPVGEPVEGALDSADDSDLFVFEAVEGEFYLLYVSGGSLADPTLALYDADGVWLDGDDDSVGYLEPLLFWEASGTGSFHVEVGGYSAGSYTLTIDVSDIDDHADSEAGATVAAVGERIEAVVDYDGDTDLFVFEAVEGETYDIEALPGTLKYLRLLLFDADGAVLDADIGPADPPPLLRWEASSTGSHYVAVEGYAFGSGGSYSLMITRR